jgi:hypothetical protein
LKPYSSAYKNPGVVSHRNSVPDPDPPDHHVLGISDPDPVVRGMDPDPNPAPDSDPSIIILSSSKNSKKHLDSYCFVTSFGLFIFCKIMYMYLQKVISRTTFF